MGVVCASLLLRRPLAPYYLTYITDPATPFTAVVEMTAFVDPAEVGGHTLVYLPKYVEPDDPLLGASDDDIRAAFWPYLARMYPHLHEDDVLAFQVSRVKRVFAIPTIGFSDAMPPMSTSVAGLHLVGSAQLPFATLNVNDTLSLVDEFIAGLAA
jgi:protoporphyrinogen oxidase